jgi:hypothetical protein
MYIGLHVLYPLFLSDFNEPWVFSPDFPKNTQVLNFLKIRPVEAELFHVDGQTDVHDGAKVTFRNFFKAPKE